MPDKPKLTRRSALSLAAIGLAGSSTVIARQSSSSGNAVLADYDDDSVVNWDADGWPQHQFDNGMTSHNAAATGPTGELSVAWTFGDATESRDAQRPVVADGTVYTFQWDRGENPVQKLHALDSEDGTEEWSAELTTTYGDTVEGRAPISEYDVDDIAVADGVVYVSRWQRTAAFDADTGEQLWAVDRGGSGISVTDESIVAAATLHDEENFEKPTGRARVLALSREDGSVRWKRTFERTEDSASRFDVSLDIVVASESVYVLPGNYEEKDGVYSLSLTDGTTEWSRDVEGLEGEPVATDDALYLTTDSSANALDAGTGDTRWTYDAPDPDDFVTVRAVGDGTAYVTFGPMGRKELVAVDTATGDERWRVETGQPYDLVVTGDVLYYTVGGEDGRDDTTDDHLILRNSSSGELLARRTLPATGDEEDGLADATDSLVPVGGMLYANADDALFAFSEASDDSGGDDGEGDGDGSEDGESDGDSGDGSDDSGGSGGSDSGDSGGSGGSDDSEEC